MQAPAAFKKVCRNLGPDIGEFAQSMTDVVQHSLIGIEPADAREIVPHINELLSGRYSKEQLRDHLWSLPGTTKFLDDGAVAAFLSTMRDILSAPPYLLR